jgi:hypothetical protein
MEPLTICPFEALSKQVQEDFLLQFDPYYDNYDLHELRFCLETIPLNQLIEEMDALFEHNLLEEIESDFVQELSDDISKNGLINIPIGMEGIHRTLAFIHLKRPMPRYTILVPPAERLLYPLPLALG